jgi:uncharacterized protein
MSASSEARHFRSSRYNVPIREGSELRYLFNCLHASLIRLPAGVGDVVDALLFCEPLDRRDVPAAVRPLFNELVRGGFFVEEQFDELGVVRDRFYSDGVGGRLSVTLLPTLACNLRCGYCYQTHTAGVMSRETRDAIVREIDTRVRHEGINELEIDWFGGEPLLAREIIQDISCRLKKVAAQHGATFRSTMATNGTLIDRAVVEMLGEIEMEELQITLDGSEEVHNARRPTAGGKPSFGAVVRGIQLASESLRVLVRINVSRDTVDDAWAVLDLLDNEGCFQSGRDVQPYIALAGPLSDVCSHAAGSMIPVPQFFDYVLRFQQAVLERRADIEIGRFLEVPRVLDRACGAQSRQSMVVVPTGNIYKCGLEVHDPVLAGAYIGDNYRAHLNYRKWVEHSPFACEECGSCRFLPICLGGCPKFNHDDGSPYYREACIYWHDYMEPILRRLARAPQVRG